MNTHVIYIPFTGVGVGGGFRSNKWFAHRIKIFKEYTLKSLINQSNKNFLLWVSFRPEEKSNSLVNEIREALDCSALNYALTFDGLMYHDDKFTFPTLKTKARNFLKMLWDCYHAQEWKPLSQLWKYTWEEKNKTLPDRLAHSLQSIKQCLGGEDEWIYMTRLDSDDMLHHEAVALIQSRAPGYRKALVMDKGYMYNVVTGQLGEWLPPTNPPFHTIVFPASVFFSAKAHLEYYGSFRSHEDIPRVFSCETLDLYQYCVTFHAKHISTAWEVPLAKRVYQQFKYARPYCYSTSGQNISTRWKSRTTGVKNHMIGEEYTEPDVKRAILANFGISV